MIRLINKHLNKLTSYLIGVVFLFQLGCVPLPSTVSSSVSTEDLEVIDNATYSPQGVVIYPPLPCLANELRTLLPEHLFLMETQKFVDELYPWMEYERFLESEEDFDNMLSKPLIENKISELGVMYLITISKASDQNLDGPMLCHAACLGALMGEKENQLHATVWSLNNRDTIAKTSVKSTGKQFLAVWFYIPLAAQSNTEKKSCSETAKLISEIL